MWLSPLETADLVTFTEEILQCDLPQSISSFDLVTSRVNPVKEQVTLIQDLHEKLLSLSTEINALKSFVLEQVFIIEKTTQDIQESPNNKDTNNTHVT